MDIERIAYALNGQESSEVFGDVEKFLLNSSYEVNWKSTYTLSPNDETQIPGMMIRTTGAIINCQVHTTPSRMLHICITPQKEITQDFLSLLRSYTPKE